MAMYYAVEFPLEDGKSKGPPIVPENKVKVENGQTKVLWSVVNENGDLMEEYFEATNLKKGSAENSSTTSKTQGKKLTLVTRRADVAKSQQN